MVVFEGMDPIFTSQMICWYVFHSNDAAIMGWTWVIHEKVKLHFWSTTIMILYKNGRFTKRFNEILIGVFI